MDRQQADSRPTAARWTARPVPESIWLVLFSFFDFKNTHSRARVHRVYRAQTYKHTTTTISRLDRVHPTTSNAYLDCRTFVYAVDFITDFSPWLVDEVKRVPATNHPGGERQGCARYRLCTAICGESRWDETLCLSGWNDPPQFNPNSTSACARDLWQCRRKRRKVASPRPRRRGAIL